MITNVQLSEDGPEHYWGFHSTGPPSTFTFLKNVVACEKVEFAGSYRIYGTPISRDEFKSEVTKLLGHPDNNYDHVLYAIHGYNVDPWGSYMQGHKFDETYKDDTGYLMIPINWRNRWELGLVS